MSKRHKSARVKGARTWWARSLGNGPGMTSNWKHWHKEAIKRRAPNTRRRRLEEDLADAVTPLD